MKAEINEHGVLEVIAENHLESYALDVWWKTNMNGCTGTFKEDMNRCFGICTVIPKITIFKRLVFRIKYFLYKR